MFVLVSLVCCGICGGTDIREGRKEVRKEKEKNRTKRKIPKEMKKEWLLPPVCWFAKVEDRCSKKI